MGFVGPAGLTAGQRTRNFADLQFEKETAKLGEVGAPLRERVSNQTANLIQQFDAMVDRAEPMLVDARDIGKAVDKAVVTKAEVSRRKVRNAYTKAEEDGSIGPLTLMMAKNHEVANVINRIAVYREEFYRSLDTFDTFGRGWLRRNDETRQQALALG